MRPEFFTVTPKDNFDEHHHHGPSSLMYRELCAQWEREDTGFTDFSTEGALMHKAVENQTVQGLDEEQAEQVGKCITLSDTILNRASEKGKYGIETFSERRLLIGRHPENGRFLTFGTADEIFLAPQQKKVYINDWKFGRRLVTPASHNLQGECYACGAFEEWDWAEEVEVTFACPRRDEVSSHVFKRADYQKMLLHIYTVIERAGNPAVQPTFSVQSCEFCRKRMACPVVKNNLFKVAAYYDPGLSHLEVAVRNAHSSQVNDPLVMSSLLKVAEVCQKWVDSVKHHGAKLAIEQGVDIPDYEMRTRSVSTKEDDGAKVYSAVKTLFTPEEFISACRVSKTKLDDIVSERASRGQKKAAREKLTETLADAGLITESEKISTYLTRKK